MSSERMATQRVPRLKGAGEALHTDLDYYSRPENYEGSNLSSLQKFMIALDKQQKAQQRPKKPKRQRREENQLFKRYRHILTPDGFLTADSSDEDKDSSGNCGPTQVPADAKKVSEITDQAAAMGGGQGSLAVATCESHTQLGGNGSASANHDLCPAACSSPALGSTGDVAQPHTPPPAPGCKDTQSSTWGSRHDSSPGLRTLSPAVRGKSPVSPVPAAGRGEGGSASKKVWMKTLIKNKFADIAADAARRKFQQAIKAVMSIRKLSAAMIKKSEEPSAMLKTFTDIIDMSDNFSENLKNQGLSFDPSYFKANKEISISSEVKNILRLPPSARTQEQIQTAMYGLQCLPSFAEYPLHMQEKLAKVAWYEVVPPKRTIIRQGHYAENFYFILSGQAVVTILIRDPKTGESHVRTANFMRKGTSFGELALLHHSRRTATVTSHDTVQLLSIGREDFFDIFMARQGEDEVPEHIRFISQLDFMKGWPLERLLEHPEYCLLHFFKRNMVIVKDSTQSEWLYIVKSGSCQVLKQLRGVTARLGIPKHEATVDEIFHLPHTGTAVRGPKVDTGMRRVRPRSHRSLPESVQDDHEGQGAFSELSASKASCRSPVTKPAHSVDKQARRFSKKHFAAAASGRAHFKAPAAAGRQPHLTESRRQRPASFVPEPSPRHAPPPVFVQVSSLKPKDVFGLEAVTFHDDLNVGATSVSLVSQGAECIMLSTDFFRKHATEQVKKNLQEIVRPYPDEVAFQESLQRKVDWELFKHTLIEDLTSPPVL